MATSTEVHYPESDGKPMAETPIHRDVMFDVIAGLQDWFAADPLAYVSGNMFLYFVEGEPRRNVSPDVMVVRGIAKAPDRRTYKTWLEGGKAPDLVIEITSGSTRREDVRHKFGLYQNILRVPEYYLFDPLGEYLDPPLQGYRLAEGAYQAIAPEAGRLPSQVVGLHLGADGRHLRLFDPVAGERLLTRKEALEREKAAREAARVLYERERKARRRLRTTVRRMDDELDRTHATIFALEDEVTALADKVASLTSSDSARATLITTQSKLIDTYREGNREAQHENERLRKENEALRAGRTPDQG